MLSWIKINNYLLIDELEIEFRENFITITGETGAGKSILLGALSLLTGKRADKSVMLDDSSKCIIEAGFSVNNDYRPFFDSHGLDFDKDSIIRREITTKGKSRAFINDTPVKLNVLKIFADMLLDIHSQHQSLLIKTYNFRNNVIDSFAEASDLVNKYGKIYHDYKKCSSDLELLEKKYAESVKEKDYISYQFQQIEDAGLVKGELEELQEEEAVLKNSEEIKNNLLYASAALYNEDNNIIEKLEEIKAGIDSIKNHFKSALEFSERIESVIIELKDLSASFENEEKNVIYDPDRLNHVAERLNLINELLTKHQKENVEELIDYKDLLENKIHNIDTDKGKIEELKKEKDLLYKDLLNEGKKLSDKRVSVVNELESKLKQMLKYLGMPEAVFSVEISEKEEPSASGLDNITFYFSANNDIKPAPLEKVASGGEMSRLMLCLKSIIAEKMQLPVIIFDEIDTGVSGEIASKMGKMMQNLSNHLQVISITHLAQVAALGEEQFHVIKEKSKTRINKLSEEQRINEIARMTGGEEINDTALKHAKSLLNQNKN